MEIELKIAIVWMPNIVFNDMLEDYWERGTSDLCSPTGNRSDEIWLGMDDI